MSAEEAKKIEVSDEYMIRTKGDVSIRLLIVSIVGILLGLLIIGGIIALIWRPETAGEYWSKILPIISGAVFGFIGFIVGQKVGPER